MIQEIFALYLKKRGATATRMFGSDGVMIGGNVMMFEWKNSLVFRLSEKDASETLKIRGASGFSPMPGGKPSKGWVAVPSSNLNLSILPVADAAYRFAASLPSKAAKGSGKKTVIKKEKGKTPIKKKAAAKKSTTKKAPAASSKKAAKPSKKSTVKTVVKSAKNKSKKK